jgi:hypothetical protein
VDDTFRWVIGISITVVLAIAVFAGNQIANKRRDRTTEIQQKLRMHFNDINSKIIKHILEMSRNLTIRNNRLVFGGYAPVLDSYQFESDESYPSFRAHFPKYVEEWKELNNQAVDSSKKLSDFFQRYDDINAQVKANEYIEDLKEKLNDFALRLNNEVEQIDKYEIGKYFRKLKKCSICMNF